MPGELYADNLITPHPERPAFDDEREPLSAVIRLEGFDEQLAVIDDRAEYEENALAAAHVVLSQVREALWYVKPTEFKDFGIEDDVVSLAALSERQAGRCIGFTVVASECLEMSGIDHWIGFVNGHSTILLPTEEGQQLNLADPLSPVLSQDLQHSMVTGGTKGHSVNDDMEEYGRSAVELNTLSLAGRARGSTAELLRDHPWLIFQRGEVPDMFAAERQAQELVAGSGNFGQPIHPSKARIFMSLFLPEEGRQMLHDYDEFRVAYSRGQLLDAAGVLYNQLGGSYPDLDARQSHVKVKAIVRELAGNGAANYAKKLLDEYFESFVLVSDDSRIPEARGDCLAIIAREAGDAEAASEAAEIYEMVLKEHRRAYREAVAGKLAKMTGLAARLRIGPTPHS
jgi:hypothetical protein